MNARLFTVALAFAATAAVAAPPVATPAPTGAPKAGESIDLKKLLPEWAKKAKRSVKDLGVYPLANSKMAAQWMGRVDDQVLELLTTQLDREGEMDAYLKLELLNFKPNIAKAEPKIQMAIVAGFPKLKPIETPSRSFMKVFDKASQKVMPEKQIKPFVDKWNSLASGKNDKNFEYRNKIISMLPRDTGMRLYGSLIDMKQRYLASEQSAKSKEVRQRSLDEAHYLWDNRLNRPNKLIQMMMEMVEEMKRLGGDDLYRQRVNRVSIDAKNGKVKLDKIGALLEGNNGQQYNDFKQYLTTPKPN